MALIAYRNLADTATVTAGNSMPGYPVSNLKTRQLSTVWRGASASNHDITVTFDAPTKCRVIGLVGCNLFGVRTSTICTVQYFVPSPPPGQPNWQDAPVFFAPDAGSPELPASVIAVIPDSVPVSRQWRIRPNWSLALGVNYYEAGRLWLGDALPIDVQSGWSFVTNDPGTLDSSAGGQVYPDRRRKGRVLRMDLRALDTKTAFGFNDPGTHDYGGPFGGGSAVIGMSDYAPSLDDMFAYAGATGEVIAVPIARAPLWVRRTAIYGHLTPDSLQITHGEGEAFDANLTVVEEF